MIRVSRDKNLKGRLDYRTSIRGEGENSEYQKKEAELKGMLNAKSYLVDVLSKRIRTKASKKITNFATSSCGRNEN